MAFNSIKSYQALKFNLTIMVKIFDLLRFLNFIYRYHNECGSHKDAKEDPTGVLDSDDSDSELDIETTLKAISPDRPWSVRNQARMHLRNKDAPYASTEDALRYWLETPTCVAARLETDNSLTLFSPYGLSDLMDLKGSAGFTLKCLNTL